MPQADSHCGPVLCSRPSSIRKIFLDFDGHTTIGAAWNRVHNRSTITTPPYDTDGNPSSFSAVEKANIYAIWRAVAEDYAVFDVDVTTEDPGGWQLPQPVRLSCWALRDAMHCC